MTCDAGSGEAIVQSASIVVPAGEAEVGGDFQLVRDIGVKTLALVGDVAGNGADAARYADRLCEDLGQAADLADPVALVEELNTRVHGDPGFDRFVTACAVVIDRLRWSAQWAFAGHIPPIGWIADFRWTGQLRASLWVSRRRVGP